MTSAADFAATFAILSNDELVASIAYQSGYAGWDGDGRKAASLAAYRAELASRTAVAA